MFSPGPATSPGYRCAPRAAQRRKETAAQLGGKLGGCRTCEQLLRMPACPPLSLPFFPCALQPHVTGLLADLAWLLADVAGLLAHITGLQVGTCGGTWQWCAAWQPHPHAVALKPISPSQHVLLLPEPLAAPRAPATRPPRECCLTPAHLPLLSPRWRPVLLVRARGVAPGCAPCLPPLLSLPAGRPTARRARHTAPPRECMRQPCMSMCVSIPSARIHSTGIPGASVPQACV